MCPTEPFNSFYKVQNTWQTMTLNHHKITRYCYTYNHKYTFCFVISDWLTEPCLKNSPAFVNKSHPVRCSCVVFLIYIQYRSIHLTALTLRKQTRLNLWLDFQVIYICAFGLRRSISVWHQVHARVHANFTGLLHYIS